MQCEVPVWKCRRRLWSRRLVAVAGPVVFAGLSVIACGHFDFGSAPSGDAMSLRDAAPLQDAMSPPDTAADCPVMPAGSSLPSLVQEIAGGRNVDPPGDIAGGRNVDPPGDLTLSVSFHCKTTMGNLLIFAGADNSGLLLKPTEDTVIWKRAAASSTHNNAEIWYGVATSDFAGTVQITAGGSANARALWMILMEWHGLDTTSPIDGTATGSSAGQSGSAFASPITTMQSGDLLLFDVAFSKGSTFGPDPQDWHPIDTATVPDVLIARAWYQIMSGSGAVSPSVSATNNDTSLPLLWDTAIAGFKALPQ